MNTHQSVSLELPFNELRERIATVLKDFTGNGFKESKLNAATAKILGFDNFKALEAALSSASIVTLQEMPIFLTNGICEDTGHLNESFFRNHRLSYGAWNGKFHPLTTDEMEYVQEEAITLPLLDATVEFGFSSLLGGSKCAMPVIDFPYYSEAFHELTDPYKGESKAQAETLVSQLSRAITPIGGVVINAGDVGERINVYICIPFDSIKRHFDDYEAWKEWLMKHLRVIERPDHPTFTTFWRIRETNDAYEFHFGHNVDHVYYNDALSKRILKSAPQESIDRALQEWHETIASFGNTSVEV